MTFKSPKPPCARLEKRAGCIQSALRILGDKWTPLLLGQLISGKKTFGELELGLAGISPRTLSERLNMLINENIIKKSLYNTRPPRYKYLLTEKGESLLDILQDMSEWGDKYQELQAIPS